MELITRESWVTGNKTGAVLKKININNTHRNEQEC